MENISKISNIVINPCHFIIYYSTGDVYECVLKNKRYCSYINGELDEDSDFPVMDLYSILKSTKNENNYLFCWLIVTIKDNRLKKNLNYKVKSIETYSEDLNSLIFNLENNYKIKFSFEKSLEYFISIVYADENIIFSAKNDKFKNILLSDIFNVYKREGKNE